MPRGLLACLLILQVGLTASNTPLPPAPCQAPRLLCGEPRGSAAPPLAPRARYLNRWRVERLPPAPAPPLLEHTRGDARFAVTANRHVRFAGDAGSTSDGDGSASDGAGSASDGSDASDDADADAAGITMSMVILGAFHTCPNDENKARPRGASRRASRRIPRRRVSAPGALAEGAPARRRSCARGAAGPRVVSLSRAQEEAAIAAAACSHRSRCPTCRRSPPWSTSISTRCGPTQPHQHTRALSQGAARPLRRMYLPRTY